MMRLDRYDLLHGLLLQFLLLFVLFDVLIVDSFFFLMFFREFHNSYINLLFLLEFYEQLLKFLGFFDCLLQFGDLSVEIADVVEGILKQGGVDFFRVNHASQNVKPAYVLSFNTWHSGLQYSLDVHITNFFPLLVQLCLEQVHLLLIFH